MYLILEKTSDISRLDGTTRRRFDKLLDKKFEDLREVEEQLLVNMLLPKEIIYLPLKTLEKGETIDRNGFLSKTESWPVYFKKSANEHYQVARVKVEG